MRSASAPAGGRTTNLAISMLHALQPRFTTPKPFTRNDHVGYVGQSVRTPGGPGTNPVKVVAGYWPAQVRVSRFCSTSIGLGSGGDRGPSRPTTLHRSQSIRARRRQEATSRAVALSVRRSGVAPTPSVADPFVRPIPGSRPDASGSHSSRHRCRANIILAAGGRRPSGSRDETARSRGETAHSGDARGVGEAASEVPAARTKPHLLGFSIPASMPLLSVLRTSRSPRPADRAASISSDSTPPLPMSPAPTS